MYKKLTTRFLCLLIVLALIFSCGGISIVNAMNTDDSTTEQVEETESETSSEAQSTQIDAKQDAVLETTSKEQDTLIDNNTMDYFKKHINTSYANPSKMELVNMMLAKQTYADKNYCKENETIDSMWAEDSLHKYITMISNYVAVYNVDDNSDYYVASIDTMHKDSESKVTDVCFARNNMNGEVVDGCIYDNKTGLAYIPKKLYFNEDKTKFVLDDIQVQLLQLIDPNELESTVDVVTESDDKVTANESTVDFFDDTVTLQTQKDMNAKNLVVAVNGIPVDEDRFDYDKTTGEITFDNYSAATMQTVSITETTPTVLESLSDSVSDLFAMKVKAEGITTDEMHALSSKKYLKPTWLTEGTLFTGGGYIHYHDGKTKCIANDQKKANKNSYYIAGGDQKNGSLDLFYRYVIGKNSSLDASILKEHITDTTKYNTFYGGLYTVNKDYIYKDYQESGNSHCKWSTSADNTDFSSDDFWKQFGEMYVNMKCAHLDVAAGETKNTTGIHSGYVPVTAYIRILKVDTTDKYVVFGMATKTISTQEGTGLYKFYYEEQSSVRVKKTYTSTAERNQAHNVNHATLKGATYGFYKTATNAKNGTNCLKTVTTGTENSSYEAYTPYVTNKDLKVSVGTTVYVKEIEAPTGLALDTKVYSIKLKALDNVDKGLTVTSSDSAQDYSILKIVKKDGNTVLTDALFTLYQKYTLDDGSSSYSPIGIFAYNSTAKAYILYERTGPNEYNAKNPLNHWKNKADDPEKGRSYSKTYAIRETKIPKKKTVSGTEVEYDGIMTVTGVSDGKTSVKYSKRVKASDYLTFKDNRNGTVTFQGSTFNAKATTSTTSVSLTFNIDNNGTPTSEPFYFNVRKSSSDMPETTSNKGKSRFNVNYGTTASTSADGAVFGLYHMGKKTGEDDPRYTLRYVLFQDATDGKTYWRWYKYVHSDGNGNVYDGVYRDKVTNEIIPNGYRKYQTPIDSTVGFTEPTDTSTWNYSKYSGQWAIRELSAATGYTKQMNWIFGKKSGSTSAVEIPVSASTSEHPSSYVEILNNEDGTINFDPDGIDVTLNAKVGKMADAAVLYGYDYSDFDLPIKKVNTANGKPMEGVEFRLYRLDTSSASGFDEEYLQSVKTDANGVATFTGLQFYGEGNIDLSDDKAQDNYYQIRECVPEGYIGEGRTPKILNFKIIGNKQIQIKDYQSNSKFAPWFSVNGQTVNKQNQVINLSTNKTIATNPLVDTTINVGTTPIVTIPNLANIGLKLTKIDKDSAEPIPGVFFTIHRLIASGTWEEAAYAIGETDADGEVRFSGLFFTDGKVANDNALDNYYQVRETIPEGYPNAGTVVKVFNFQIRPDNTIKISSYQTSDPNVKGSSIFGWDWHGKFSLSVEDTDKLGSSNVDINTYVSSVYSDPLSIVVPNSKGGYVYIKKQSANTSLNNNNSCYSLEGAKYGLYLSYADAKADTNRVSLTKADGTQTDTFVTKADGTTEKVKVPLGTYFVRELQASKGFSLDGTQEEPVKVEVTANNTEDNPTVYTSNEPPLNDPFNLKLQKLDKDTGKPVAQGSASLEGAIFEIKYFDNTDEKVDGTAKKTWYFKTDKNGEFDAQNDNLLVNNNKYKSDDLYYNTQKRVIYPLGTYQIKEVQAPEKYQLSGNMKFNNQDNSVDVKKGLHLVIAQDANGKVYYKTGDVPINADNLMLDVYEKVYEGDIKIVKLDTDGKTPLKGVKFKLVGDDGAEYTGTTNEEGKLSFEKLVPQHYVLTETKTLPGHQLLKDSIDITVPIELTTDEAKKQNVDTSKAVWDETTQTWCFYSQTCEIANDVEFSLPMTGGSSIPYIPMVIALILIGSGVIALRLRKAN